MKVKNGIYDGLNLKGIKKKKLGQKLNEIQNQPEDDKKEGDIYYTPNALARELISITPLHAGQSVLDPAKGTGSFYNNYPTDLRETSSAEITEGSDFFAITNKYDWLVTNPPFSNFKKWLIHSCSLAKVGFAYILPCHGLTEHRIRACADLGFNITSITFFKNPTEWNLGFQMAWVIWEKTPAGNITVLNHPKTHQLGLGQWCRPEGVNGN